MKRTIISGTSEATKVYVDAYIQENAVPSYCIIKFEDKLKIADVRLLKKRLAVKEKNRLVVIENTILPEAQHALLKTLEELPEDTSFFILTQQEDDLLATIRSRCSIVRLKSCLADEDVLDSSIVSKYFQSKDIIEILEYSFLLAGEVMEANPDAAVLQLRRAMIHSVSSGDTNTSLVIAKCLNELQTVNALIRTNNLNKQLAYESLFARCKIG